MQKTVPEAVVFAGGFWYTSMTFDRAAGNRIIKMIAGSGPPPVT